MVKNLNNKTLVNLYCIIGSLLLLGCQNELPEPGIHNAESIIITDDLSAILSIIKADKNENTSNKNCPEITSAEVFPINGCKDFTVGVGLDGWIYIETEVTICCACAVCGVYEAEYEKSQFPSEIRKITIKTSSPVIFGDHEISIAPGDYDVDEKGLILGLKYNVVKNK